MKMTKAMVLSAAFALASAPSYCAQISGTDFENKSAGAVIGAGVEDITGQGIYWLGGDTDSESVVAENTNTYSAACGQPDAFANSAQTKYLSVNTTARLRRMVNPATIDVNLEETVTPYSLGLGDDEEPVDGDHLYIDTLVKFSVSDVAPTAQTGDKLVLWLNTDNKLCILSRAYTSTSEDDPTIDPTDESVVTSTVVTDGTYSPDQWYRLTVKAQCDPLDLTALELLVWVDGQPVTYQDSDYQAFSRQVFNLLEAYAVDDGVDISETKSLMQQKRLFLAVDADGRTISEVSFEGVGALDDISFTADDPAFLTGSTTLAFTLALGEGVTAVEYAVNGGTAVSVSATATISNLSANDQIAVTGVTPDAWYSTTPTLSVSGGATLDGSTFTVTADGATGTVASTYVAPSAVIGEALPGVTTAQLKSWADGNSLSYSDILAADSALVANAYLMNSSSLATAPGLKITSIEKTADGVSLTLAKTAGSAESPLDSADLNGTVYYWATDTLGDWGEPQSVSVTEGTTSITTTKKFFKFKVDL